MVRVEGRKHLPVVGQLQLSWPSSMGFRHSLNTCHVGGAREGVQPGEEVLHR